MKSCRKSNNNQIIWETTCEILAFIVKRENDTVWERERKKIINYNIYLNHRWILLDSLCVHFLWALKCAWITTNKEESLIFRHLCVCISTFTAQPFNLTFKIYNNQEIRFHVILIVSWTFWSEKTIHFEIESESIQILSKGEWEKEQWSVQGADSVGVFQRIKRHSV